MIGTGKFATSCSRKSRHPSSYPARMTLRRLAVMNLIAQSAIIVTGVTVRVTGSGLGCPTWPQCTPGSYVPTVHQAETWHKYVEFGNRTLTFALTAIAVGVLFAAWRSFEIDRRTRMLAAVPLLGTMVQAVLGGITVLTELHPGTVMAHFLISVLLVAASHALLVRVSHRIVDPLKPNMLVDLGSRALVVLGFIVIFLGTIVTGSGPHSGDADQPARLGFDPALIAWIHADAVWFISGISVSLWLYVRFVVQHRELESRLQFLVIIIAMQGAVGYVQYWTGLPWPLVVVHVAMAALFWIAILNVRATVRAALSAGTDLRRLPETATTNT